MEDIIFMSLDVVNLLVETTGIPFLNHIPVDNYPFNRIIISLTNPTRLSGFQHNLNMTDEDDTPEFRAAKGTYLKPSRFVKAFLEAQGVYPSDQEVLNYGQKLAELLRDRATKESKIYSGFEVKVTSTPSKVYGMTYKYGGNLGDSCMNNKDPEMFELYDSSPNIECVYVVDSDEVLIGRTIVAKNVVMNDKKVSVAFRLYYKDSLVQSFLKSWLLDNGYYVPKSDSYVSEGFIDPEIKETVYPEKMYFDTEIDMMELSMVPYVDQFQQVNSDSTYTYYLVWSKSTGAPGRYETSLVNTDGSDEEGVLCRGSFIGNCTLCDERIEEGDDYSYIGEDLVCECCRNNEASYCECCNEWYWDTDGVEVRDAHYTTIMCEDCAINYAFQCDECGDWYAGRLEVVVEGDSVCQDCFDKMETFDCPDCGSHNSVDSSCCWDCGEYFFNCPECGAINTTSSEECWDCREEFIKCHNCGSPNIEKSDTCWDCREFLCEETYEDTCE